MATNCFKTKILDKIKISSFFIIFVERNRHSAYAERWQSYKRNMKKIFSLLILVLFFNNSVFSQKIEIIDNKAIHFELTQKNDTIDFIVVDTVLTKRKPIFLFCQGSLPIPLFTKMDDKSLFMFGGGISNFDIKSITKHYHLVVISMPKTPLIASIEHLNKSYCYIPDTSQKQVFRQDFLKADYAENYVLRANAVLDFLSKQKWVDNKKLVVAGQSQGSKIATLLASKNKRITHLGLFSYNPYGRIDQMIRQERKYAENGKQTWEQAIQNIDYWTNFWKDINNSELRKEKPELIAWYSFSEPTIDKLLTVDIPIFLSYGTNDITSDLCDLIPLKFIEKGKNNLTIKRKIGLEHNFFEVTENGRPNYNKPHWIEVMNEFLKWTLE